MRSTNEMRVEDLRSIVASLPFDLAEGYSKATQRMFQTPKVETGYAVFVTTLAGAELCYTKAETKAEATKMAHQAIKDGWSEFGVFIREENTGEVWYEEMAKESEEEIETIVSSWKARPKDITPSSAVKLIAAHYNRIAQFLDRAMRVRIHRNQSADGEVLEGLKDSVTSESTDEPSLMIVRWRYNNLAEMFGSPDNCDAYEDVLDEQKRDPFKMDRDCNRLKCALTETKWGRSKIGRKHHIQLFNLVLRSLGQELVNPIPRKVEFEVENEAGEVEVWERPRDDHQPVLSPAELCELIAHKLALGVEHEATTVEEVDELMSNFQRIARWLQRRQDHPKFEGDLNPSELAKPEHLRHKFHEREQWSAGDTYVAIQGLRGIPIMGAMSYAETEVAERFVWPEPMVKKTPIKSWKTLTETYKVKGPERWLRVGRSGAWIWDAPEGEVTEKRTVECVRYVDPELIVTKNAHIEQIVKSNVKSFPMPEFVSKDWDERLSVYGGRMVKEKWVAGYPEHYEGPSFIRIEDGQPVKAGACTMHDGWLFSQWKRDGKKGECPTCDHSHIQKIHIHQDWWAPKVDVENEYCSACNEKVADCLCSGKNKSYVVRNTFQADKHMVGVVNMCSQKGCGKPIGPSEHWLVVRETKERTEIRPNRKGGRCHCKKPWAKRKFISLAPNVRMPLLVPALRRYIEDCVSQRMFVSAPKLHVTFKRGKFIGGRADLMQRIEVELEDAIERGDPKQFDLRDELAKLKEAEKDYARTWYILHVFIPITDDAWWLFDADHLPSIKEGETRRGSWGIHAQLYGPRQHLLELVTDFNGRVLIDEYSEDSEGLWHLEATKSCDGPTFEKAIRKKFWAQVREAASDVKKLEAIANDPYIMK